MKFTELALKKPLLDAVAKAGYTEPSPIQEKAIPELLKGRDLLACAQTGTGKTAAFALPILNDLEMLGHPKLRALVLTPTRELAVQNFENFKMYGRYLKLRACCVYGGTPMGAQRKALQAGCDILVATPGRLLDFMNQGLISFDALQIFVLDEADRMFDMGFIQDVRKIASTMPAKRQTIMCSATMPPEIEELARQFLKDPADIRIAPQASPADTVTQYICFTEKADKKRVLIDMLKKGDIAKAIVFVRTKAGADRLVKQLAQADIQSLAIHGNKTQGQRQNALQRFKTDQIHVLVATDVAARGIDIAGITHVFNYDLPDERESYIHRIGRAGRAGETGISIAFCCEAELELLADIEKMLGKEIPEMKTDYTVKLERLKPKGGNQRSSASRRPSRSSGSQQGRRGTASRRPANGTESAARKPARNKSTDDQSEKAHRPSSSAGARRQAPAGRHASSDQDRGHRTGQAAGRHEPSHAGGGRPRRKGPQITPQKQSQSTGPAVQRFAGQGQSVRPVRKK